MCHLDGELQQSKVGLILRIKFQNDGNSNYNLVWMENIFNHNQDTYTKIVNVVMT